MHRTVHILAAHVALAICAFCGFAAAEEEPSIVDRLRSGLDGVARGIDYVGERAEDLLGPGLGIGEERAAAHTVSRTLVERFPVGPQPVVSLSNEFGNIQVETWDERVVQAEAEISVGAESADTARDVAQRIEVQTANTEELVDLRTRLPDTRQEKGLAFVAVSYTLTLPRAASLVVDNFFGDIAVRGTGGLAAIEAQYGGVEVADAAGPVKVRAYGDFPVRVHGLKQGGTFHLHRGRGAFSGISGELNVHAFGGEVRLSALAPESFVSVTADSAPVRVELAPEARPDLTATVLYGRLESTLPLLRTAQGNKIVARATDAEPSQRLVLAAAFGDIVIEQLPAPGAPPVAPAGGSQPFNELVTFTEEAPEGLPIRISAARGNVRIDGADTNTVQVSATRIVWAGAAAEAPPYFEGLRVNLRREEDGIVLDTLIDATGSAPCAACRIDLQISCPRTSPVEIHAEDGNTTAYGVGGPVTVQQARGLVTVEHIKGPVVINNQNGGISAVDCAATVEATARYGDVSLRNVFSNINATCADGRTVIDSPGGEVRVRSTGGDVRILALEPIGGNFDVLTDNGNISMLVSPTSDAELTVKTERGVVHSAIPLTGSISRDSRTFQGRLQEGLYQVKLEARNGDIVLD